MLDDVGRKLLAWAASVAGSVHVTLSPPDDEIANDVVSLYLVQILQRPLKRNAQQCSWPFQLEFLVTADAQTPLDAHRLLGGLLAAALEAPNYEVHCALPLELWRALDCRPRPAFLLSVPWQHQKAYKPAPAVKEIEIRSLAVTAGDSPNE